MIPDELVEGIHYYIENGFYASLPNSTCCSGDIAANRDAGIVHTDTSRKESRVSRTAVSPGRKTGVRMGKCQSRVAAPVVA